MSYELRSAGRLVAFVIGLGVVGFLMHGLLEASSSKVAFNIAVENECMSIEDDHDYADCVEAIALRQVVKEARRKELR